MHYQLIIGWMHTGHSLFIVAGAAIVTVILLWLYLDPKVKAGTQQGLPAIDPWKNNWVYSI